MTHRTFINLNLKLIARNWLFWKHKKAHKAHVSIAETMVQKAGICSVLKTDCQLQEYIIRNKGTHLQLFSFQFQLDIIYLLFEIFFHIIRIFLDI